MGLAFWQSLPGQILIGLALIAAFMVLVRIFEPKERS